MSGNLYNIIFYVNNIVNDKKENKINNTESINSLSPKIKSSKLKKNNSFERLRNKSMDDFMKHHVPWIL